MRESHMAVQLEIGGEQHEGLLLVHEGSLRGAPTQQWFLDSDTVLWLLERVKAGTIDADAAAEALRGELRWDSGCCSACDAAAESYPEALRRYEQELERWQQDQEAMTPESHPYLLSKNRIHAWNCHATGGARGPDHPGSTLHAYAGRHYHTLGDLTSMFAELREASLIWRRATAQEIQQRLAQRRPGARDPRCKLCSPELPGAWRSETSDVTPSRPGTGT